MLAPACPFEGGAASRRGSSAWEHNQQLRLAAVAIAAVACAHVLP